MISTDLNTLIISTKEVRTILLPFYMNLREVSNSAKITYRLIMTITLCCLSAEPEVQQEVYVKTPGTQRTLSECCLFSFSLLVSLGQWPLWVQPTSKSVKLS